MTLAITNLTNNATLSTANLVTGDGVFDDLMETAQLHLDAQFNLNRINATDYAKVYLGLIQSVLTASVGYALGVEKGNAESTLLFQKEVTEFAQTGQSTKTAPTSGSILGAQALLTAEQAKGFKWNADQKYLKTILDAWAINISTAGVAATGVDAIKETGVASVNVKIANAEPTG